MSCTMAIVKMETSLLFVASSDRWKKLAFSPAAPRLSPTIVLGFFLMRPRVHWLNACTWPKRAIVK